MVSEKFLTLDLGRLALRSCSTALFFLVWLLPQALVAEGTQTGIVTGTVVDTDGTVVEGAVITLDGERGERVQSSGPEGRFRFQSLDVGTYRAVVTLPGVEGWTASGAVDVYIGKVSELHLVLGQADGEPAAVEETIQVYAEAPLVDRYSTRVGGNVRFEFLDELPVERFYQSAALLFPGVSGGEDGNPNVGGSLRSNNLYLVDGVDTTDPSTGLFGLNLQYEAVKEVEVATSSIAPQYGRLSGAVINVVTRSGGDELDGTVRWIATDRDADAGYDRVDNAVETLGTEIAVANSGSDGVDGYLSAALGGPVVKDRLWFYAGYENPQSSFRRPVLEGARHWDLDLDGENQAYKLTWQASDSTTVVGQYTSDSLERNDFQPFNDGPVENFTPGSGKSGFGANFFPGDLHAVEARSQEGEFGKLQLAAIFGSNVSLSVTAAAQDRRFERRNANARGLSGGAPHFDLDRGFVFNGATVVGEEERPREQINALADRFFQTRRLDQQVKLGLDYQNTESKRDLNFPGIAGVDRATQNAVEGQLYLDATFEVAADGTPSFQPFVLWNFWARPARETREESTAVFLSDEITLKRWFFNVGLRFADVQGEDQDGRQLVDAQTVSPRLGFTYDLTERGTTLIRGSYGRFYEPFLQKYLDFFDRFGIFSGFTDYIWQPTFERILELPPDPRCANEDPSNPNSICWILPLQDPTASLQIAPPNTELDPTYVDEFTLGFEHQVSSQLAVNLTYIYREWDDIWDDIFSLRPVLEPDGTVARDTDGAFLFTDFTSRVANIDAARREYEAVQLLVQKRFSSSWQLLGSYTWSETEGNIFENDGFDVFGDFSDLLGVGDPAFRALVEQDLANRFGLAPYDREHQLKLFASYRIPFERFSASLGTAIRYESGLPFQREVDGTFNFSRFATRRGSERLDDVFQWDLSLATDVRLRGDFSLEVKGEVFNLTDEQEQIGVETFDDGTASNFGQPRSIFDIQPPRSYRLTVGFRF